MKVIVNKFIRIVDGYILKVYKKTDKELFLCHSDNIFTNVFRDKNNSIISNIIVSLSLFQMRGPLVYTNTKFRTFAPYNYPTFNCISCCIIHKGGSLSLCLHWIQRCITVSSHAYKGKQCGFGHKAYRIALLHKSIYY